MCATCGCGNDSAVITLAGNGHHDHHHDHPHDHEHPHDHAHVHTETISLEQKVLAKNDLIAEGNRASALAKRNILALNITSSPGAGKTTLLERTIGKLANHRTVSVIEGDQETLLDAERIRAAGAAAVQVNTGAGCHLDAEMIRRALETLNPQPQSLLFIENVGNLVCPACSTSASTANSWSSRSPRSADKPLKYPHMFAVAGLVVLNKIDLLPYVDFDLEKFGNFVKSINPTAEILPLSATTGDGTAAWHDWIELRANGKHVPTTR
jgi:hydrogenase nickel incorporation protein HypB